jgi:hypothetical protein
MNRAASEPLSPDGIFLAACLWREKGLGRTVSLPFWMAGEQRHHRLSPRIGLDWMASFLDCIAAAAQAGTGELNRLQQAEQKGLTIASTARSRLPEALETVLRVPVITARGLAASLRISPQAALGLIGQLREAGIVREATGRASWRAFIVT